MSRTLGKKVTKFVGNFSNMSSIVLILLLLSPFPSPFGFCRLIGVHACILRQLAKFSPDLEGHVLTKLQYWGGKRASETQRKLKRFNRDSGASLQISVLYDGRTSPDKLPILESQCFLL